MTFRQIVLGGVAAATIVIAGCGGGSSNPSSSGSSSGGTTSTSISGPLDTLQTALTTNVLTPLENATAGTPLQPVLKCADIVANQNTLDVLDAILNGVQNGNLSSTTPAQVQALLLAMTQNLGSTLTALSGGAGCTGTGSGSVPGTNPLAGTPLAPLGDALLPVLQQLQGTLGAGGGAPSLTTLSGYAHQLNTALQSGLQQVPANVYQQPVVGGILTTLKNGGNDLDTLLAAAAASNSTGFQNATAELLDHLLVNLLTGVVPAAYVENAAGKPGTLTGPIDSAAQTFSQAVASALGGSSASLLDALSSTQVNNVLGTVTTTLLPSILGPLQQALAGNTGSAGSITGTPLDGLLAPLSTVLNTILGTAGTSCVFAGTPLSALCKLLP